MRTATIATSIVRTAGRVEACTISQPAVAVSATPEAEASAPTTVLRARGWRDRVGGVAGPAGAVVGRERRDGRGRDACGGCDGERHLGGGQRDDVVGQLQQRRPVGHDDDRAGPAELDDGVRDDLLGEVVEVGGRLVEQHPGPVGDDHPGQRQPGPLAGGERDAVLAHGGGQAAGQVADPFLEGDPAQRRPQQLVVRVGGGDAEVVGDAPGDEHRALGQPGDVRPPGRSADGPAGRGDRAAGQREQAGDGAEQRGLAAAGRPAQHGHAGARQHGVEVRDRRPGPAVVRRR